MNGFVPVVLLLTLAGLVPGRLAAAAAPAAEERFFEAGVVRASEEAGDVNAYPVIARTADGSLFAVWTHLRRGAQKPVIVGSFSRNGGRDWSKPVTLIDTPGKDDYDPNIVIDGHRILVYSTTTGDVSKGIDKSWVWMTSTENAGKDWTKPKEIVLPFQYFVGKRHQGILLRDGTLAMPFSWDLPAQRLQPVKTEGEMDLDSGVLLSRDHGLTWTPRGALHISEPKTEPGATGGLCEPALVELDNGDLYLLMRNGTSHIYEARSHDQGRSWTEPKPSALAGHNAPMALWRLESNPKEVIVIWNNSPRNRYPLSVAITADGGQSWSRPKDVAVSNGLEISYPGITQAADGMFVAVWQQSLPNGGRDIRWARFNRAWALQP